MAMIVYPKHRAIGSGDLRVGIGGTEGGVERGFGAVGLKGGRCMKGVGGLGPRNGWGEKMQEWEGGA